MIMEPKKLDEYWDALKRAFQKNRLRTIILLSIALVLTSLGIFSKAYISTLGNRLATTEKHVGVIENKLTNLELHLQQSLELKQNIYVTQSQTITNIMQIQKEIANIQESIRDFYTLSIVERFDSLDSNSARRVFSDNGCSFAYFELSHIPLTNSVMIYDSYNKFYPTTHQTIEHNIIILHEFGELDKPYKRNNSSLYIKYHPDTFTKEPLLTVQGMQFFGYSNNGARATFKPRE